MAVAQLIETLDAGGAEALAVDIANALAARGMDSHLIVIDGGGRFQARVHEDVHLHDLQSPRCLGRFPVRVLYFFHTYRRLAKIISKQRITAIQSHLPKANFFGLALAALNRVRVHPTVHNNKEFDYGDNPAYLIEKGRRAAYWLMLRVNAEMIAVSPKVKLAMAEELGVVGTRLADRIVAVSNGVSIVEELQKSERARVRSFWEVGDDDVLLVAAGRFSQQKNFESLVGALNKLPLKLQKWKCIIGGEGELRESLQCQIDKAELTDKILLPGHVSELRSLMAAADIFCLSSRFEGLPLVMLEAMSTGLPVISFEIPGVTEVVTHGKDGLVSPLGDEAAFADSIAKLVDNQALRRELGGAGRSLVQKKYSFDRMVDGLVSLYGNRI